MDQRLRAQRALFARKSRILWALAVIALLYAFAVRYLPTVADVLLLGDTTAGTAAGIGGVILGLYVCSHPAGNAIDLIFMERSGPRRLLAEWSGIGWLALNGAVLVLGWVVIVLGAIQLAGRAGQ